MGQKGRPKKFVEGTRVTIYMSLDKVDKLDEIADILAENRQDLIRKVLDDFISKNNDGFVFKCETCGFVLKVNRPSEEIRKIIKDHQRKCGVLDDRPGRVKSK